jgi:hypothetical protein
MRPSHKWYLVSIILSASGIFASIRGDILHKREDKAEKTWDSATGETNHVSLSTADTERSYDQADPHGIQAGFKGNASSGL